MHFAKGPRPELKKHYLHYLTEVLSDSIDNQVIECFVEAWEADHAENLEGTDELEELLNMPFKVVEQNE